MMSELDAAPEIKSSVSLIVLEFLYELNAARISFDVTSAFAIFLFFSSAARKSHDWASLALTDLDTRVK